jgi:DNA-binding IclR family transcriptional regulator
MHAPSFREWLRNCARDAPAAELLPMLVAQSGAGISRDDLARALRLPPETLDDLLRALTATGQVRMLKVGRRTVYRAAG